MPERGRFIEPARRSVRSGAEEKRRSLIAADQIEAAWIACASHILRTRLICPLPDRLAPARLLTTSTVRDTRNLIRAAIRRRCLIESLQEPTSKLEVILSLRGSPILKRKRLGKGTGGAADHRRT